MKYALLVFVASCMPRVELVPPAIGHGAIDAKVVATSWNEVDDDDDWYDSYELELTNPAAAPVEVPVPDIRLIDVSLLGGTRLEYAPRSAGLGKLPTSRPDRQELPAFVRVAAGHTARVWIAFGGKRDPRARLSRMELLRVPGAGDIVLDAVTPDHVLGIRQYWGRRRAAGLAFRPYVDTGRHHRAVPVPFVAAISFLSCQLEFDGHAGYQVYYDADHGHYDRSSGFVGGGDTTWHFIRWLGIYGDVDYERRSGSNGMALGAGLALTMTDTAPGSAFYRFYEPTVQFRLGWVETFVNGEAWGAVRAGFEIAGWGLY